MNKEVSYLIAKLLKDKRFEQKVNVKYVYCEGGEVDGFNTVSSDTYENFNLEYPERQKFINKSGIDELEEFSAPTIADVVMWLYDKHGIWISVKKDYHNGSLLGFESIVDCNDGFIDCGTFNTPTEAYEKAIEHALKKLI